ncbi:hypothetical protein Misp01_52710 [Microtetraspora sp. NBRC 13810]|uniref:transporter substrate-binding domain-containing protein n=1 Tax=Microtetraspora sp. NBRC 13810 TaxID=3030990 RepID=UPI002554CAAA|nr:transporter substrate-binding domain-containing protein [Microtetraspora sp. NBRC 13810]GLW10142.1 hypothetical protein Misp01_52710 [Microtetraspora sp. NBRC 13810]
MTTDHPGWSTFEPGPNRRTGFDIALAEWLGNRLGRDVAFLDLTLAERIEALKSSQVQMVISTFSMTDERRKEIDFAGPYMVTRQGVLVREGDERIRTHADLIGGDRNVCVARGTTSEEQLRPHDGKGLTLTVETALKDCLRRLVDGQVDAFSTDQLVLRGFARSTPATRVVEGLTFGAEEQYGIGLPDQSRQQCDLLTRHLRTFLNEGYWGDFLERELQPENPVAHKPLKLDPCENATP